MEEWIGPTPPENKLPGRIYECSNWDKTIEFAFTMQYKVVADMLALLPPAILFSGWQFPIDRLRLQSVVLHLLFGAGFSAFELSLESALSSRLKSLSGVMKDFQGTFAHLLVVGFHGGALQYWMVLGAQ